MPMRAAPRLGPAPGEEVAVSKKEGSKVPLLLSRDQLLQQPRRRRTSLEMTMKMSSARYQERQTSNPARQRIQIPKSMRKATPMKRTLTAQPVEVIMTLENQQAALLDAPVLRVLCLFLHELLTSFIAFPVLSGVWSLGLRSILLNARLRPNQIPCSLAATPNEQPLVYIGTHGVCLSRKKRARFALTLSLVEFNTKNTL